jgi:hypothetical protein
MLRKKRPAFSEALFIIKGETAGPNDVAKPSQDEDLFRKPQYRRCRGHRVDPCDVIAERRPQRQVTEGNWVQRGSGGRMISNRVSELPKALDPEEAESKIEHILAEIAGWHSDDNEKLVSDEAMV